MNTRPSLTLLLLADFIGISAAATAQLGGPGRGQDAGNQTMDDAFLEALYYYACGDVAKGYELLDHALTTLKPTDDSVDHLSLYRTCFNLAHGNFDMFTQHSRSAVDAIARIQQKAQKADSDYVRLAVLLPTGKRSYWLDGDTLRAFLQTPGTSPWKEWAKWELDYQDAREFGDKYRFWKKEYVTFFDSRIIADGIHRELLRQLQTKTRPITRGYLIETMGVFIRSDVEHLKEYCRTLGAICGSPDQGAELERELEQVAKKANRLARSVSSSPAGDVMTKIFVNLTPRLPEVLWDFYEGIRKSGRPIPEAVPRDRDEFLKNVANVRVVAEIVRRRLASGGGDQPRK